MAKYRIKEIVYVNGSKGYKVQGKTSLGWHTHKTEFLTLDRAEKEIKMIEGQRIKQINYIELN